MFLHGHPDHAAFRKHMRDPRLLDPIVLLGDLESFVEAAPMEDRRKFGA